MNSLTAATTAISLKNQLFLKFLWAFIHSFIYWHGHPINTFFLLSLCSSVWHWTQYPPASNSKWQDYICAFLLQTFLYGALWEGLHSMECKFLPQRSSCVQPASSQISHTVVFVGRRSPRWKGYTDTLRDENLVAQKEDIIQAGRDPMGKDSLRPWGQWDQARTEFTFPFCITSDSDGPDSLEQDIIQDQDLTLVASEATLWPTMNCERPV